jgi:hypothetical protein
VSVAIPDWNNAAASDVPMYEVAEELCCMIVAVACTLVKIEDTF